jgi:hypothetical protein
MNILVISQPPKKYETLALLRQSRQGRLLIFACDSSL